MACPFTQVACAGVLQVPTRPSPCLSFPIRRDAAIPLSSRSEKGLRLGRARKAFLGVGAHAGGRGAQRLSPNFAEAEKVTRYGVSLRAFYSRRLPLMGTASLGSRTGLFKAGGSAFSLSPFPASSTWARVQGAGLGASPGDSWGLGEEAGGPGGEQQKRSSWGRVVSVVAHWELAWSAGTALSHGKLRCFLSPLARTVLP